MYKCVWVRLKFGHGRHLNSMICLQCNLSLGMHTASSRECPTSKHSYFHCREFIALKECHKLSVKMDGKFKISKENERKKLGKILEFVSIE